MARSAPSSAEKRNKVPTGRTVVRPVLRLERTGASSLCAQGRKQELEMIRGRRCPVSTGRGRPVCRPAVRPAPGAHAGAPLPVSVGSGGKRGEVPPQGGGEGPLSHGLRPCQLPHRGSQDCAAEIHRVRPAVGAKKINGGVAFVDENPALPWGSIITCTTRQVDRLSMASLLPTSNRMLHRPGGLQFTTEYGIPY